MNAIDALCRIAAPELNFLLTTPPFNTNTGADFGWFCREHAFCTSVIGELLGVQSQVVRGDVIVYVLGEVRLTTQATTTDHAWCITNEISPFDLSPTFRHRWADPQLDGPVCGPKQNGGFDIRMLPDGTSDGITSGAGTFICYVPQTILPYTAHDLVSNPLLLLEDEESASISRAISLHTFLLINGCVQRMSRNLQQRDALMMLKKRHKKSTPKLLHLLESNRQPDAQA